MNKIVVFGDSHSHYYDVKKVSSSHVMRDTSIYGYEIERIGFPGASVKGFGRRKTSTLNLTDTIIQSIGSEDIVVLAFGQVDMELGLYYRRFVKDSNETLAEFIQDCLDSYKILIQATKKKAKHVIIKGINLPVMIDQSRAIEYTKRIITENLNNSSEIKIVFNNLQQRLPGIFSRISIAEEFNQVLELMCFELEIEYFDVNNDISYPNGIVMEEFISAVSDIHLISSLKIRHIHFRALKNIVKNVLMK